MLESWALQERATLKSYAEFYRRANRTSAFLAVQVLISPRGKSRILSSDLPHSSLALHSSGIMQAGH